MYAYTHTLIHTYINTYTYMYIYTYTYIDTFFKVIQLSVKLDRQHTLYIEGSADIHSPKC